MRRYKNRIFILSIFLFSLFAVSANAATIAETGFEGLPGELGYSSSVINGVPVIDEIDDGSGSNTVLRMGGSAPQDSVREIGLVTFNSVNLTNFANVIVSLVWQVPSGNWEPNDNLIITVTPNVGAPLEYPQDGDDFDLIVGDGWQALNFVPLPAGATSATLSIRVDANGGQELLWFDNISFDGDSTASIPTLSEWGMIIFSILMAGAAITMIRRNQVA